MEKSLDELLNDDEPTEIEATEPETIGRPRDEHGRFTAKETGVEPQQEEPVAEPVPPTERLPKDVYEPLRAVRDENKQLKETLEALQQQIQAFQKPQEPPAPPPSVWEDEQGFQGHIVNTAVQQASLNATLNLSEMLARRDNPDFDDMKSKFLQMAEMNPTLREKALADPDPWGAAYRIAKNAAAIEEIGATDLEALKAKMREELLAEMQAQVPVARPAVPPTLTTERNVGARSGPTWSGPKSLSDLLR